MLDAQRTPGTARRRWLARLLALLLAAFPGAVPADPIGERVVEGSASFDRSTPGLTVIETPDANVIIDYQSFDILSGETVQFVQPDAASRVLNQILSAAPTSIDGALLANGQVYVVNPAGVVFGANAVVDVAQLFAAAGRMDHADFLQHVDRFTELSGAVQNAGDLHADAVHLIGRMVENSGSISAPDGAVVMAAGEMVLIGRPSSGVYVALAAGTPGPGAEPAVANSGSIDAGPDGSVSLVASDMYALAFQQTPAGSVRAGDIHIEGGDTGLVDVAGTLDASDARPGESGGVVRVLGDRVLLRDASVDASGSAGGGEILIGGDYQGQGDLRTASRTFVTADTELDASATSDGDGGEVVVWADEASWFHGSAAARGGASGGDGGLVETSGRELLSVAGAVVDTGAPSGQVGTWLLDPTNIRVVADANQDTADLTQVDQFGDADLDGANNETAIGVSAINNAAATVTLQAENDVSFEVDVAMTTDGAGLTAQAGNDITVGGSITTTNGDVNLSANDPGGTQTGTGSININSPIDVSGGAFTATVTGGTGTVNLGANLTSTGGTLTFNAPVVLTADTTLTDAGDTTFNSTLDGPHDLTLNVGGTTQFIGAVGSTTPIGAGAADTDFSLRIESAGPTVFESTLETADAITQLNTAGEVTFRDDVTTGVGNPGRSDLLGNVTLDGLTWTSAQAVTFGANQLTLSGGPTSISAVGLEFQGLIDGAQQLTADAGGGILVFAADVGSQTPLAGLTARGGGGVQFRQTIDSITTSGGDIVFDDAALFGFPGVMTLSALNGAGITFSGNVTGSRDLVLNSSGTTSFAGTVGGGMSSVTTDVGGTTEIGASITTTGGTQTYNDAVLLTGAATLTDTGATGVTFNSTLDGANDLVLNVAGTTTFNQAVGGITPLGDGSGNAITINSAGETFFESTLATAAGLLQNNNAGRVTFSGDVTITGNVATTFHESVTLDGLTFTGGTQSVNFNGPVMLSGGTATLSSQNVSFNSSLDGAQALVVNSPGTTAFRGGVGTVTPLLGLTTDLGGITVPETGAIVVNGDILFGDVVRFITGVGPRTMGITTTNGGALTFGSDVFGAWNLILNSAGPTTFVGAVGNPVGVGRGVGAAITINSAGPTTFESTLVANAGISQSDAAGSITFRDNVTLGVGGDPTANLLGNVIFDGLTFVGRTDVNLGNAATDQVTLTGGPVTIRAVAGDVNAEAQIDGAQDLTFDVTTGLTRINGEIGGATPLLSVTTVAGGRTEIGASITTAGGTQTYNDPVDLTGPAILTDTGGTGVTFNDTVDGAQDLTLNVTGATSFSGAVGGTTPVGDGTGAALTINSGGTTTFGSTLATASGITQADGAGAVTFQGDVTLGDGDTATDLRGDVTLDGLTFTGQDAVTFGNAATDQVTLSGGAVTVGTSDDDVTFGARVDGAQPLAVNSGAGTTRFNAAVGGATPLTSVTTDAAGRTEIGASVTTVGGTQTYNDPVDLTGPATLTDLGGTGITFNNTLDGAQDLTLNVAALTRFNAPVGGVTPLASLTTDPLGRTAIGASITTAGGTQTYLDPVDLIGPVTLTDIGGTGISFNDTVDGASDLILNVAALTIFNAPVGGVTPLTSLTTDAPGRTAIAASITTAGGTQTYHDPVDVFGPVTLTDTGGTGITFNNTVDGPSDLILNVAATTRFNAPVGGFGPLLSLTTDAPGRTEIAAPITTLGGTQIYNDPVDLFGPVTLTDLGMTGITFNNTVDGPSDLILNVAATTRFNAPVGAVTPLASLTTDALGRTEIAASITTAGGTQTYNDPVDLTGSATLTDTGGTGITFSSTLDGAQDLTLNVTSATSFNGAVGGTTPLGDGTGAALTINSAGTTTFGSTLATASGVSQADGAGAVTFRGDVVLGDGDTESDLRGNVTLDGLTFTAEDAVRLGNAAADQVTLSGGAVTVATSNDDVTFHGRVDGAQALAVNAGAGTTRFNAAVGGTTPLTSLTTDAGGRTQIGASITTAGGTQTYNDPVDLTGPATLTDTGGTGVTFSSTVDGAQDLTLNVTSATSFNGAVGGTTPLGDGTGAALTINSGGTTTFGSTLATASGISQADGAGAVTFRGDVTLGDGDTESDLRGNVTLDGLTFTAQDAVRFGNAAVDQVTLAGGAVTVATSNDDVTFHGRVDGAQALAVNAGAGTTRFNAAVGGTTPLASLTTDLGGRTEIGASITTAGGTQTYNDPVDLTGSATLTDTGGTGITFSSTLDGAQDLTLNVTAATSFNGAVGGTTPLGDGVGAALTINSAGTTTFGSTLATASGISQADAAGEVTFMGDVVLGDGDTPTTLLGATTLDGLTFTAHDAVSFGNAGTDQVTLSGGAVTVATSNDEVTFAAQVDGAQALAVAAGTATTRFNATVGGATPLSSLTTDAGGRTEIGASISTAGGTQTYNDPIDLTGSATLTDTGGSGVVFNSTVDGARDLTLNVTGPTSFNGAVGATTPIGAGAGPALTIDSAGTTTFGSTLSTASGISQAEGAGAVTFRDDVVLGAGATPTTLLGNVILDGLTFTANGGATFGNAATDQVTLSGGPVVLATSDDPLTFAARVDGGQDLSVNSGLSTTSFNAAVGAATPLGDGTGAALTLSSAGPTSFASTLATTSGIAQANGAGTVTFRENVALGAGDTATTLLGNTTLDGLAFTSDGAVSFGDAATDQVLLSGGPVTVATSNDAVTFAARVDGAQALAVNAGTATTRFGADVGGVTPLLSVTTDAGGQTQIGASITTSGGTQTYNDAVELTAASVLTDTGGTGITFNSTLDGAQDVLLNVSGATLFNGAVGATQPLGDGTGAALTINSPGPTTFGSTLATASGIAQPTGAGRVTFRDNVTLGAGDTPTTVFGNVTLDGLTFTANGDVSFGNAATDQVTLSGGPVSIATSDDDLTFTARVDGGQDLALNAGAGTTAFIGAVGSVTPLGDGTGPAVTIESAGPTTFANTLETASGIAQADGAGPVTFRENVTVGEGDTPTTLLGDVVLDGLTFTANGDVTFGNAAVDQVTVSSGAVTIATSDDDVTFEAHVDGAEDLTVNAGTGVTRFNAELGGATPLASVTTDAGGWTEIGASISTSGGTQTYNDPVILTGPATLTDTGGTGVTFGSTLDGAHNLTMNVSALTTFVGAVGATTPIGSGSGPSITIDSPGTTTFESTLETANGVEVGPGAGPVNLPDDGGSPGPGPEPEPEADPNPVLPEITDDETARGTEREAAQAPDAPAAPQRWRVRTDDLLAFLDCARLEGDSAGVPSSCSPAYESLAALPQQGALAGVAAGSEGAADERAGEPIRLAPPIGAAERPPSTAQLEALRIYRRLQREDARTALAETVATYMRETGAEHVRGPALRGWIDRSGTQARAAGYLDEIGELLARLRSSGLRPGDAERASLRTLERIAPANLGARELGAAASSS